MSNRNSGVGTATPSEYVREPIRTDRKQREQERLDALLADGLHSGHSIAVDARFWQDLKQEALKVTKGRPRRASRE